MGPWLPPPQHPFFTKRCAQMHYIRKPHPRAFQNTQIIRIRSIVMEKEQIIHGSIFFYQKLDIFLDFPGDLRSGNDMYDITLYFEPRVPQARENFWTNINYKNPPFIRTPPC